MYDGGVCVSGAEIASLAGILHLRRSIRTAIGFDDQEMSELADCTHIAVVTEPEVVAAHEAIASICLCKSWAELEILR